MNYISRLYKNEDTSVDTNEKTDGIFISLFILNIQPHILYNSDNNFGFASGDISKRTCTLIDTYFVSFGKLFTDGS